MLESLEIDPRIKMRDPKDVITLPRVIRVNNFDEETVKIFRSGINATGNTGQPVLPVIIDSDGGDPYALLAMVDLIQVSKIPVATIVAGKAFSCGAVLFCCGTEGYRFMGPNATLMIHDVLSANAEFKKAKEIMSDAVETNRLNKRLYNLIDKNTGKPKGYTYELVHKRARADWYLNPKQAVKFGYANHIRIPVYNVSVKVDMNFI